MLNSCFVVALYVIILAILMFKSDFFVWIIKSFFLFSGSNQRSSYTDKIIKSTGILTIVFTCSWYAFAVVSCVQPLFFPYYFLMVRICRFMTGFLVSFSSLISQTLNIPISYVVMTAVIYSTLEDSYLRNLPQNEAYIPSDLIYYSRVSQQLSPTVRLITSTSS